MAEKRKKELTLCVKTSAKKTYTIEFFNSVQWKDGKNGLYRLRINRAWHDDGKKRHLYLDMTQALSVAGQLAAQQPLDTAASQESPPPDIPYGSRVSVPNGRTLAGVAMRDVTWSSTPPIQAYDGEWYIGVSLHGKGGVFVKVQDVIIKEGGAKRHPPHK